MGKGSRFCVVAQGFSPEQLDTVLGQWLRVMLVTVREIELTLDASDVTPGISRVLTAYFEDEERFGAHGFHSALLETLPDGGKRVVISRASFRS